MAYPKTKTDNYLRNISFEKYEPKSKKHKKADNTCKSLFKNINSKIYDDILSCKTGMDYIILSKNIHAKKYINVVYNNNIELLSNTISNHNKDYINSLHKIIILYNIIHRKIITDSIKEWILKYHNKIILIRDTLHEYIRIFEKPTNNYIISKIFELCYSNSTINIIDELKLQFESRHCMPLLKQLLVNRGNTYLLAYLKKCNYKIMPTIDNELLMVIFCLYNSENLFTSPIADKILKLMSNMKIEDRTLNKKLVLFLLAKNLQFSYIRPFIDDNKEVISDDCFNEIIFWLQNQKLLPDNLIDKETYDYIHDLLYLTINKKDIILHDRLLFINMPITYYDRIREIKVNHDNIIILKDYLINQVMINERIICHDNFRIMMNKLSFDHNVVLSIFSFCYKKKKMDKRQIIDISTDIIEKNELIDFIFIGELYMKFKIFDLVGIYMLDINNYRNIFYPYNIYNYFDDNEKKTVDKFISSIFDDGFQFYYFIREFNLRYEDFIDSVSVNLNDYVIVDTLIPYYSMKNKENNFKLLILKNMMINHFLTSYSNINLDQQRYKTLLKICDKNELQKMYINARGELCVHIFPDDYHKYSNILPSIFMNNFLELLAYYCDHNLDTKVLSKFNINCHINEYTLLIINFIQNKNKYTYTKYLDEILFRVKNWNIINNVKIKLQDRTTKIIMNRINPKIPDFDTETINFIVDPENIIQSLINIREIHQSYYLNKLCIKYENSPGVGDGVLRDFCNRFIQECIDKKYLKKCENNTYILVKKENSFIVAQFIVNMILIEKIPLPIKLHPIIILIICDLYKYDYSFIKHFLTDEMKEQLNCSKYEYLIENMLLKTVNDTIIINGEYYSIGLRKKIKQVRAIQKILLTRQDCIDYVDEKFKFDMWYEFNHLYKSNSLYFNIMRSIIMEKLPHGNPNYITINTIQDLLYGKKITIEDIISKLQINYCVTSWYTTKLLDRKYEKHTKNSNILIYKFDDKDHDIKNIRRDIENALRYLYGKFEDFEKKLINFWYGINSTTTDNKIYPKIIVDDIDYNLLNKSPIKSQTCFFILYIPFYAIDKEIVDIEELESFFEEKISKDKYRECIITKRLYDSIIYGFDKMKEASMVFTYV